MTGARYNVIHLIYHNKMSEGHYKDYQFSAESKNMHWRTGLHDMDETLRYPQCLELPQEGENFVSFDVHTRERTSSAQFYPNAVAGSDTTVTAKKSPAKRAVKTATKPATNTAIKTASKTPAKSSKPRRSS
jgi:creatinine amidohydrolase/Fe(II)-dependent formamide hydrolase-like protein